MSLDNLDALLESFGRDKDQFLSSKDIVDDVLLNWGQGAIDSIRKVLRKEGLFASGSLYQEIEPWKIKKIQDGIQIYLEMLEHWEEVDKGRIKGKKFTDQELRSLEEWIRIKGIPSKWKMSTPSAVFLISRAIYKKGTIKRYGYRGSNFLQQAMTDSIMNELQEKFAKSFEGYYLKGIKKT
jgi:hypothetical protein